MIVTLHKYQNEIKVDAVCALRAIADNILRSMFLMFYSSMEKEGLCLKDFCVSHMDGQTSKKENWNFKVTKNKVVVEISTHLQQPFT